MTWTDIEVDGFPRPAGLGFIAAARRYAEIIDLEFPVFPRPAGLGFIAAPSRRPSRPATPIAVSEAGRPRLHCGLVYRTRTGEMVRSSFRGRPASASLRHVRHVVAGGVVHRVVSEAGRPRLHCGQFSTVCGVSLFPFPRPAGLGFIAALRAASWRSRSRTSFRGRPASASLRPDGPAADGDRLHRVSEAGRPRLHCGEARDRPGGHASRRFPRPAGLGFIAAGPRRTRNPSARTVSEAGRPRLHCGHIDRAPIPNPARARFRGRPASASLRRRAARVGTGTCPGFRGRPASASLRRSAISDRPAFSPDGFRGRPASASLRHVSVVVVSREWLGSFRGRPASASLRLVTAHGLPGERPRFRGRPASASLRHVSGARSASRTGRRFRGRPASASLRLEPRRPRRPLRRRVSEAGRPRLHCGNSFVRRMKSERS